MYLVVFRESVFNLVQTKKRSVSKNTFHNVVGIYNDRKTIANSLLNKFSSDENNSNFELTETDCRITIKFNTTINYENHENIPIQLRWHRDSVSCHSCFIGPETLIKKRFIYEIINIDDKIDKAYARLHLSC